MTMTTDRDETYQEVRFAKDLRYVTEYVVPASRTIPLLDDLADNEWSLEPGKVIMVNDRSTLRDTYGYWAMFALGYGAGVITILCAAGR